MFTQFPEYIEKEELIEALRQIKNREHISVNEVIAIVNSLETVDATSFC